MFQTKLFKWLLILSRASISNTLNVLNTINWGHIKNMIEEFFTPDWKYKAFSYFLLTYYFNKTFNKKINVLNENKNDWTPSFNLYLLWKVSMPSAKPSNEEDGMTVISWR